MAFDPIKDLTEFVDLLNKPEVKVDLLKTLTSAAVTVVLTVMLGVMVSNLQKA